MKLNSSLLMYTTAYKLIVLLLAFLAITSFPQFLRCETDAAAPYCTLPFLQHSYPWVVTSIVVHNY